MDENELALFLQSINLGVDPGVFSQAQSSNDPNVITRFIRKNEVVFSGSSLCPDKQPNFFFDQTLVNQFCQKSNRLQLASSNNASIFADGEGVIDITTNAFARVLTTSNNIVYLNQNYLTLNIAPYGANTLGASDYAADDVVYQTSSGVVTFQGRVQYYDRSNGVLAILPVDGTMNAAGNVTNSTFIKYNSTVLSNAISIIRGDVFPAGGKIRSAVNASNVGTIVTLAHSSGSFAKSNGANTQSILVQANSYSVAVGNTITITSGTGQNTVKTITAVTANGLELTLNSALSTALTSNSRYTFGPHVVDEFGKITGIFNIPETESDNFPAGQRVFTIADVNASSNNSYLMRASAFYNVLGAPQIVYPPPPPPPVPARRRDPLAQTFFTPQVKDKVDGLAKTNYGVYVSSVDLFFSEKPILADLQMPVTVQIVEVENGIPTETVVAEKAVECKDVNISTAPDVANTSTITNFKFSDPVYLEPDTEYALVVKSDSPDYNVYIAELGGSVIGAVPPRRVSIQPYIGSLFKSQNASTWTPIQNQDLMFRIKKCVFTVNSSGTLLLKPLNRTANANIDSLLLHSVERNHKPTISRYKFKSNNVNNIQDADYTYIPINTVYNFGGDLLTSTKTSDRRRVIVRGDSSSFSTGVDFYTTDADVSPFVNLERISAIGYENNINDGSISNADVSITSAGTHATAGGITVTISPPDDPNGVTATAHVSALSGGGVGTVVIDNGGSGYYTTPTITFTDPGSVSNATGVIAGETSASGGNCKARYITKQVTLADGFDAGDLRVYLDCNRPRGTNVHVYYKVMSAADPDNFSNKKWQLMSKVTDTYSHDQSEIIELEYRPSLDKNVLSYVEGGVTYPLGGTFKYFAIKIVLTAADPTVTPYLRNYRAIATPAG
jgi:hypothetical protein